MITAIAVSLLLVLSGLIGWALGVRRNRHFHQIERRLNDAAFPYYTAERMNRLRSELGWVASRSISTQEQM